MLIAFMISSLFCGALLAYGAVVNRDRLRRVAAERDANKLHSRFVAETRTNQDAGMRYATISYLRARLSSR